MSIFSIDNTGVRNEEYICGNDNAKQTKGTIAQIKFFNNECFKPYLPYFVQRDIRVRDLLNWGFFEMLSWDDRLNWIIRNGTSDEIYLSDMICQIRFETLGSEFLTKISPDNQQLLMSGNWFDMKIVYNMFPKKVGGKGARRHTLIFRGSNWKLHNNEIKVEYLSYIQPFQCNETKTIYKATLLNDSKEFHIGFVDNKPCLNLDVYCNSEVQSKLEWFSPSVHKSLIQKCIRVRPINVKIDDVLYPTETVLVTSFIMLVKCPGAFVPNLRKFVNGTESAFKRLAVSLIEDSSCNKKDIVFLFMAALASRNGYKPSEQFINYCINVIIAGLNDEYFVYNGHNLKNTQLSQEDCMICTMIKTLGSFEGDINMIISVLENNLLKEKSKIERPEVMDISHCLDHHSITEICHFYTECNLNPAQIFKLIWDNCTGINSRKRNFKECDLEIMKAQKRLWIVKSNKPKIERELGSYFISGKMNLDPSWIAGIIGPISNNVDGESVISFFNPDDLNNILTIKDPSRDSDLVISDEVKSYASRSIENKMSRITTSIKSDIIDVDINCFYQAGNFVLSDGTQWEEYCKRRFKIPIINTIQPIYNLDDLVKYAFTTKSNGVEIKSIKRISNIISNLDIRLLSRLAMYVRNIKREIQINKISRDGSGTYLDTSFLDSYVFKILLRFCIIIPYVIEIDSTLIFKIKYFPFWNIIRKIIINKLSNHKLEIWPHKFKDKRVLWQNQIDASNDILEKINKGKRGNIIWMEMGLGKTLIVMNVIGRLIDQLKMSKYCIWVLTPSSVQNIIDQINESSIPYNILNGTKGGNRTILPYCINLVVHDHMILLSEELLSVTSETFFVFDEIHFMFDNSKRTSIALQLSKTSSMFVGMTGTLIKNRNIEGNNLIEWVSQISEFEITKTNYMIGIASLISGKIELPIKKIRSLINLDIDIPEYFDLVESKFGGRAEKTDFVKASNICFEVIYKGIIQRVLGYLKSGEKCIFVVTKDNLTQQRMNTELSSYGIKCHMIEKDNPINITSESGNKGIQVVITTVRKDTGYDVTASRIMITAPYFTNQARRQQLEGRLVRISQKSPEVLFETLHCGILSYVMENHDVARILAKSISDLQKII